MIVSVAYFRQKVEVRDGKREREEEKDREREKRWTLLFSRGNEHI